MSALRQHRYVSYGPTCGDHFEREVAAAQADGVQPCSHCQARHPRRMPQEKAERMRQVIAPA